MKGVPSDAKVAWISKPDTSEIGKNKTAKVEVTFGNGDKQQYDVVYDVYGKSKDAGDQGEDPLSNVTPAKDAPKFTQGQSISDTDAGKFVSGVPEGATVTWTKNHEPDTTNPGTGKSAQVTITYQGKSKTVDVTYDVTPNKSDKGGSTTDKGGRDQTPVTPAPATPSKHASDADTYKPDIKPITIAQGQTPHPEDGIGNKDQLPKGTTYTWKSGQVPDTSTSGSQSTTIVITYPDGSKTEVQVNVETRQTESDQTKQVDDLVVSEKTTKSTTANNTNGKVINRHGKAKNNNFADQVAKKATINKQTSRLPQTGNHTTALQALGLAVIALSGLVFFDKKKNKD
ncbi:Rib/alpha-like domain-containing protein [Lactobacillus mulieris]|uniref:Rib/alpha-like domain-containing protein n=3 Tax=Lactobacillus mulieris TaxID=2508708 RepID=UPI00143318A4|nr:Rib/alpha-like domain-containing protein [Lactobacillus mulieris]MCW8105132.1 Rib/alpha-like domain-containing protein [Lactobacillus mulieris]MDK6802930.1 Rib/alpha-like domain-containing protein [Lactobacillus mulieris]MDK8382046.1 Rib/alpha-like domain-containing protein [Lactobacillus mulieris]NKC41236.1 LPXTG cell wall anchor domain-containing protein [Lactobacillus mulieris]